MKFDFSFLLRQWNPAVQDAFVPVLEKGLAWLRNCQDPDKRPLATFDFDNTCIYNDITEATFFHLIRERRFSFKPAFWDTIPEKYGKREIQESLQACRDIPSSTIYDHPIYQRYRYLMQGVYLELEKNEGVDVAFKFSTEAFAGLTPAELVEIGQWVIGIEEATPKHIHAIHDPEGKGKPYTVRRGIRINPLVRDAILALQLAGVETVIVTASPRFLVAPYTQRLGVPFQTVLGSDLELEPTGEFSNRLVTPAPIYRSKVEAIRHHFRRDPDMAFGDSQWDGPMLEACTGPKVFMRHNGYTLPEAIQNLNPYIQDSLPFPE